MKYALAIATFATFAVAAAGAQGARTTKDGVYTDAQAARGKKQYVANCASCHQEGLQGADLAPALKGDDFLLPWTSQSVNELFERISKTMPADAPGSLSAQDSADIVSYILQANRMPAGADELKGDATAMKAIGIAK
jgi:mono/diheme cytochrome c family protein